MVKDIELKTIYNKIHYRLSWVCFIIGGSIIAWFIAIGLASYGKNTSDNTESKKNILNKSYQKFIYWVGTILLCIFVLSFIIAIFF